MNSGHLSSSCLSTPHEFTLLITKVFLLLVLKPVATVYQAFTRDHFTCVITIGSHYSLSPFYR